jgi:hypothetical protein
MSVLVYKCCVQVRQRTLSRAKLYYNISIYIIIILYIINKYTSP